MNFLARSISAVLALFCCGDICALPIRPLETENGLWGRDRVLVQIRKDAVAKGGIPTGAAQWKNRLGLPAEAVLTAMRRPPAGALDRLDLDRPILVELNGKMTIDAAVNQLRKHADVLFAEPDYVGRGGGAPNDPNYPLQWHHQTIQSEEAWTISTGSSGVVVAMLDTGINQSLAEFAGRLLPGHNYVVNNNDPSDDQGHGTACTGVLAANANNHVLVTGVDWHCRILPEKVIGADNFGFYSWWAQAIYDATDAGAKVINLSAGGESDSAALAAAIDYAIAHNVIFVTLTHNDGARAITFPGRLPQCITLGATERDGTRALFSNYGPAIDLVAPGRDIYTVGRNGGLEYWYGTSESAPQVSGVAALVASLRPSINQRTMELLLAATAEDGTGRPEEDTPGWDEYHGYGNLNARYAVQMAAQQAPLPEPLNLSTRLRVLPGDNALIGGFIVTGAHAKNTLIRAIGPSLTSGGILDPLLDPTLELYNSAGILIAQNDDWRTSQQSDIQMTGIAPAHDRESAIEKILAPGAYTAIVRGKNNSVGIALVEAYDLQQTPNSKLANISTRGFVDIGDNAMIGGFIVGAASNYVLRGIGPLLADAGIANPLANPTVELRNSNGDVLAQNDDWQAGPNASQIQSLGLAPTRPEESAAFANLPGGAYTAILRGKNDTTGVGLVEIYNVP
jgi:subtilisin family serine protease